MTDSPQLILNPVTKKFEMLTLKQWRHLKAGFGINDDQPEYVLDFSIDIAHALTIYSPALNIFSAVHSHILESIFKNLILDPEKLYGICRILNECIIFEELEVHYRNLYELKRVIHALSKQRNPVSKKVRNRRRSRK